MADDVPVCDVLCEAMEYLSKLGLNLRNRSERLKEKRISKAKLKNYHAVQKAANKVLLICQLSKKSLDNVETGIRKVLSVADDQQHPTTSKGGKTSVRKTDKATDEHFEKSTKNIVETSVKEKPHYHCFEYRSLKLKVAKRISIKHFTSVKVMAKRIPMSMLENYPVYHNCKLYLMRERQALNENAEFEKEDTIVEKRADKSPHNEKLDLKKSIIEHSEIKDLNNLPTTLGQESIINERNVESIPEQKKRNKSSSVSSIENEHIVCKNKKHAKKNNGNESSSESQNEIRSVDEANKEPKSAEQKWSKHSQTSKGKSTCKYRNKSKHYVSSEEDSTLKSEIKSKQCSKRSEDEITLKPLSSENENTHKSNNSSEDGIVQESQKKPKQAPSSEDESCNKPNKVSKHCNRYKDKSRKKKLKHSCSSEDESTYKSRKKTKHSAECSELLSSEDEISHKSQRKSKYCNRSEDESKCKKKILKRVMIINDNSDDEKEKQKQCETNSYENGSEVKDCATDHESEKNNLSNVISQENQGDEHTGDTKDSEQQVINPEPKTSLIKCVDLNRLLKPSLLENASVTVKAVSKTSLLNRKHSVGDNKTIGQDFSEENKLKKKHSSKKVEFDDEEAFWIEKRKVVKTFKPKQFSVHLRNLPELTVAFLQLHDLKKVTQGGSVICEVGTEIAEVLSENRCSSVRATNNPENTKQVCQNDHAGQPELIDKVKSALLNDSESENSDTEQIKQKIKNTLLNKSDSENDKQKEHKKIDCDTNAQTIKRSLLLESDSDDQNIEKPCSHATSNKHLVKANSTIDRSDVSEKLNMVEQMSDTNQDTNKKALLNDSDSDSVYKQKKKKKHKNYRKKYKRKRNLRSHSHSESDSEKNEKTSKKKKDNTKKAKSSSETNSDNEKQKNVKKSKCDDKAENAALMNDSDSDRSKDKENVTDPEINAQTDKGCLLHSDSDENDEEGKTKIDSSEHKADDVENSLPDESSSPKIEDKNVKDKKSQDSEESFKSVKDSLETSDSQKNDEIKDKGSLKTHNERNENQQKEISQCSKANSGSDDSEKETSQEKLKEANKDKNNDSENKKASDHERTPSTEGYEKELAKSSLLKDSSGDSPKSVKSSMSNDKPKLKRKHIMESMHAKKMLLTYSSSSEDEHLKSVVKDIKNNLLQALNSDEEEMPAATFQRRTSSSDSDLDILKRVKKKKKTSKTLEKEDLGKSDNKDDDSSNCSKKKVRLP